MDVMNHWSWIVRLDLLRLDTTSLHHLISQGIPAKPSSFPTFLSTAVSTCYLVMLLVCCKQPRRALLLANSVPHTPPSVSTASYSMLNTHQL